jgi:hypothetical protein
MRIYEKENESRFERFKRWLGGDGSSQYTSSGRRVDVLERIVDLLMFLGKIVFASGSILFTCAFLIMAYLTWIKSL